VRNLTPPGSLRSSRGIQGRTTSRDPFRAKPVLKCHPDKVQDAAPKALKQVEFEKVQRAYEILSDDVRRGQYDDRVKLAELRKEIVVASQPRGNPFEYDFRATQPRRPSVYGRKYAVPYVSDDVKTKYN